MPPEPPANGYTEAPLLAPNSQNEDASGLDYSTNHSVDMYPVENSLQPPPPVQRVMDPGFVDMSGASFPELIDLAKTINAHSSSASFNLTDTLAATDSLLSNSRTRTSFEHASIPFSEDSASYLEDLSPQPELDKEMPSVSPLPSLPMEISLNTTSKVDAQETVLPSDETEGPILPKTLQSDGDRAAQELTEETVLN
ncbi:Golgi reassembly-stacking protein 1 [Varanus komodoensis]|nr:Golgi reassembly-stacking protein 1 [Varanus komodoensis]